MHNYLISIDWLQVCGRMTDQPAEVIKIQRFGVLAPFVDEIHLDPSSKYSPIFTKVFDVVSNGIVYAQLCYAPRTSVLDRNLASIKLENRVLYSQDRIKILYQICDAVRFEITGITRLDLCYDCNKLANNMDPADLVYQYVCNKPMRKGHIHRSGSDRFVANGSRKWHQHAKITSIRFGSKKSAVGAYIYNKTLELIEVKDKPWIRDCWQKAGLISEVSPELSELTKQQREYMVNENSLIGYCKQSVWRFEISIKAEGRDMLRLSDGGLFRLSTADAENQIDVEELFYIYAQKAFDFRRNTGQKNIRHYKPMHIFERGNVSCNYRPVHVSRLLDSGRTEKVCANKLDKLLRTYSDLPTDIQLAVSKTIGFLMQISGQKRDACQKREYAHYLDQLQGSEFYAKSLENAIKMTIQQHINNCMASWMITADVDDAKKKQFMEDFLAYCENGSGPLDPKTVKNTPPKAEEDTTLTDDYVPYNSI